MLLKLFFSFLLIFTNIVSAKGFNYLYQSSKGLMMGEAYTTLADGVAALFYNPALIARNSILIFRPMPFDFQTFDILDNRDMLDELDTKDIANFADQVIGKSLHVSTSFLPSLQFSLLSFTYFNSIKSNIIIRDRVHPILDLDYRWDSGLAMGAGFVPYGNPQKGASLAVGVGFKQISRESIHGQYDVFGPTIADLIFSGTDKLQDFRNALGYAKGKGQGFDLGADWRYHTSSDMIALGVSILDIFNTNMRVFEGTGSVPRQDMLIRAGGSFSHRFSFLADLTASFDIHPIRRSGGIREKVHAGLRIGLPLLDFYLGSNKGKFSYGVTCDLYFMELGVGYYEVDVGGMESNRLIAYLSLLDFEF